MTLRQRSVYLLLLGSGACGLVYQVAWFRELRLIFGGSTAASSAVLGIFIGGLGLGGALLGERADARENPLRLYALLEAGAALGALASPLLLWLVRFVYVLLGGTSTLGEAGGVVVRLLLAALVLGVPTVLMGGTLPAAARALESDDDAARTTVALLYGVNTLGAVAGSLFSSFYALQVLGTRETLWAGGALNLVVAGAGYLLSRGFPAKPAEPLKHETKGKAKKREPQEKDPAPEAAPTRFVLAASASVGLVFFMMETVWLRMLAPLLGGTLQQFGLVTAVALAGIGLGGLGHALRHRERPATLAVFATTCLLEAAALALPLALGDRLAVAQIFDRALGVTGAAGQLLAWVRLTSVVVLPAALVAGYQFPLLIGLLGRGGERVGRHVGLAYAWNTAGAVAGALLGGFVLIPALGAVGCWRALTGALLVLGLTAAVLAFPNGRRWRPLVFQAALAALGLALALADGPSAAWRHTPIGAGRVSANRFGGPNDIEAWRRNAARELLWSKDGVEATVALARHDDLAFIVNGKSDGSISDGGTQIMGGVLGAVLHPNPKSALVIGLGTGSSAGWLGALEGMERVDVVEIEPLILDVARAFKAINHGALENPRVHVLHGDAREVLLASKQQYDVIFSEPSNPYRAGIASLYTQEFYRGARDRLRPQGVFVQWVQAYEIDGQTLRTIFATLGSVFGNVEVYRGGPHDLLLVASAAPLHYDADTLRSRLAQPTYAEALLHGWHAVGLEGLLSHYLASDKLVRELVSAVPTEPNTDDRNVVEFGLARQVGITDTGPIEFELQGLSHRRAADRPAVIGAVDWDVVVDHQLAEWTAGVHALPPIEDISLASEAAGHRAQARANFLHGNPADVLAEWTKQPEPPRAPLDQRMLVQVAIGAQDPEAPQRVDALGPTLAGEQELYRASLSGFDLPALCEHLTSAFRDYQADPWLDPSLLELALGRVTGMVALRPQCARDLIQVLRTPFAGYSCDVQRRAAVMALAESTFPGPECLDAVEVLGTPFPWSQRELTFRRNCFREAAPARLPEAQAELDRFLADAPHSLVTGLTGTEGSAEPERH